jgi:hypothetical protein
MDEFMGARERWPRLKDIRGVDEPVISEAAMYSHDPSEEYMWQRDSPELD